VDAAREHAELAQEMRRLGGRPRYAGPTDSFTTEGRLYYGVRVPDARQLAKGWSREHRDASADDMLDLVDRFIAGESFDEKTFGALLLAIDKQAKRATTPARLDQWLSELGGWAEVDSLCQNMFTAEQLLADWPAWRSLITKLSADENINKRRASLVLLTGPAHYSSDQRFADLAFTTIDVLEAEREILITKAVSWLLRCLITHHRDAVDEYLRDHAATLPKLAIRETRTKLDTGTKSGRSRPSTQVTEVTHM
jgi:3-methyladenine DNA glycosylase AlkD